MKVFAIVQEKGGVGKSMVAYLLASMLGKLGYKVMLLDADPQGTNLRKKAINPELPFHCAPTGGDIEAAVKSCLDYDYVAIDCQPRVIDESYLIAASIADLTLIPTRPNGDDSAPLVKLIPDLEEIAYGQIRLIFNFFRGTIAHREGVDLVKRLLVLDALKSRIAIRSAYEEMSFSAIPIWETGNETANLETLALTREVLKIIGDDNG